MTLAARLVSSLVRVFPQDRLRAGPPPALAAARGANCSLQAAFVALGEKPVEVTCRCVVDGVAARVRRVGLVPVAHATTDLDDGNRDGRDRLPGFVPDPLLESDRVLAAPGEATAFWITLAVPADAAPGERAVRVELAAKDGATIELAATLTIAATVQPARDGFPITHWFHVDCLADRYGVQPYDDAFWPICEAYVRNYVAHGCDTLYVPAFTPPLDGVRKPQVQLMAVDRAADGSWSFDWSRVARWVALARACGVKRFEWSHLFTQWGCERAIRVYDRAGALCWPVETRATDDVYRRFLGAWLPELGRFLDANGARDASFFHVSDEPHGAHIANYRAARGMLRELAPWMRVIEALSDAPFAAEGLVDTPIPVLSSVKDFAKAGIDAWAYYCCWPRGAYLNRFLDTPSPTIAMHGFLFHRMRAQGFLHWGFNYWYRCQTTQLIDPYQVTDAGNWPSWAAGDPFVVYPGERGPVDSLRWELFGEAMQDLALLRAQAVDPDAAWLGEIGGYDDFPRDARWIGRARARLLRGATARAG